MLAGNLEMRLSDGEDFLALNGWRESPQRSVIVFDVNTEFIVCHSYFVNLDKFWLDCWIILWF